MGTGFARYWRDLSINRKVPLLTVSVTVMACAIVAGIAAGASFLTTSSLLTSHVQYVAESKRDALVTLLDTAKREIEALQSNPSLQEAADNLDMGFASLTQGEKSELSSAKQKGQGLAAWAEGKTEFYVGAFVHADGW